MITLFQFATSPFAQKVRRALAYKGLAYRIEEVVRADVAGGRYAHVSPTGKFPAILTAGGTAVWDSTDIVRYLDEIAPERPLVPRAPRDAALAHVFEDWADESLYFYEMTMRLAWPHNLDGPALDEFAATMPGIPRDQLKQGLLDGVGALVKAQGLGRKPAERVVEDARRHFMALDAWLDGRDWLVGDQLTVADLATCAQVSALLYAREVREIARGATNVQPWLDRIDAVAPDR
jgi:glutathione S-transferase